MLSASKSGQFGGYTISRSVRLRSSASAYFNRTPAGAGTSNTKMTFSSWVKRGTLGSGTQGLITGSTTDGVQFWNDNIDVYFSGGANRVTTSAVYRDPSAWYHIVVSIDTTQATAANRILIYVNGVQITSTTGTPPAQNATFNMNQASAQRLGRDGGTGYFDGYFAEQNVIDGQALTPSSFGQYNAYGVWTPTKYNGTYGTNGFYLNFSDNSGATSTTIGKDYSGNGNNWTPNNISVTAGATYDSMIDVPTLNSPTAANYAVMNPLDKLDGSITGGNLDVTTGTVGGSNCRATIAMSSGKWYWEMTPTSNGGIADLGISIYPGSDVKQGTIYTYQADTGNKYSTAGGAAAFGATYTTNDIIGIAYDATNGKIWWAKNGTWQASGDPANGANAAFTGITGDAYAYITDRNVGGTCVVSANFGQRPFSYTPPTGFLALNTFNLPTPTIGNGANYMAATLYTGTGASLSVSNGNNNTTGVTFKPDLVWIKSRSAATDHKLTDSVRGTTKALISDSTAAETTDANGLTAFGTGGFTVGSDTTYNNNTATYVGWQWQAGQGTTSSNTSGSITSTVSVNTTAGFSIVTYTGTGANATVGHGLGVAPKMIIVKNRGPLTWDWIVYHGSLGATQYMILDTTAAAASSALAWNNTEPTSSVFSLGTGASVNRSGDSHVAYLFAEIAGFSKFGSYTGNGANDGPFVYCGFRPRWVMVKRTDTAGFDWFVWDSSRSTYNAVSLYLNPDTSGAEGSGSGLNFVSNGFKWYNDTGTSVNASGATYIYAAFAENPFKLALAR